MYEYTVCYEADDLAYKETVETIKAAFPDLRIKISPEDVDGSNLTSFTKGKKRVIKVYNDYGLDEVCIKSEVDLSHIDFSKIKASA